MADSPVGGAAVAAEKLLSDRGSATLDQLALAALIESGRYDRHLRRMRTIYTSRRASLIAALARMRPASGCAPLNRLSAPSPTC